MRDAALPAARCPLLADKTGRLATGRERVLAGLLDDLTGHVAVGRAVDANTTLGAVATIAVRHLRAVEAAAFRDERAALFSATTRCGAEASSPFDACPECRADRACPADIWPQAIAVALTGAQRKLNLKTAGVWLGPTARLSEHASTRPTVRRARRLAHQRQDRRDPPRRRPRAGPLRRAARAARAAARPPASPRDRRSR